MMLPSFFKWLLFLFCFLATTARQSVADTNIKDIGEISVISATFRLEPSKTARLLGHLSRRQLVVVLNDKQKGYLHVETRLVHGGQWIKGWTPEWAVHILSRTEIEAHLVALQEKQIRETPSATAKKFSVPHRVSLKKASRSRPMRRVAGSVYPASGSGHWIQEVNENGSIVVLEDGSIWQINPIDEVTTSIWLPVSDIVVVENRDAEFQYRLINKDDKETVEAKFLGFQ